MEYDEQEEYATVTSAPPKRPAGRTKFRETRHPVYRGVRRRGPAGRWVCEYQDDMAATPSSYDYAYYGNMDFDQPSYYYDGMGGGEYQSWQMDGDDDGGAGGYGGGDVTLWSY
uniref:AP2/ERF domain-containing protein n=1 Tax=Oryza glumipatula TaxID=40148 RepID=A0A0E0A4E2_9ORYZ